MNRPSESGMMNTSDLLAVFHFPSGACDEPRSVPSPPVAKVKCVGPEQLGRMVSWFADFGTV